MIYVSAIRKHELADSKCINLSRNILRKKIEQNPVTYEYAEIERIDGLLMWCLARMQKSAVIRELLKRVPEVRS
jgi:hypothetical protein